MLVIYGHESAWDWLGRVELSRGLMWRVDRAANLTPRRRWREIHPFSAHMPTRYETHLSHSFLDATRFVDTPIHFHTGVKLPNSFDFRYVYFSSLDEALQFSDKIIFSWIRLERDFTPGRTLHREIEVFIYTGLSNQELCCACNINKLNKRVIFVKRTERIFINQW